MGGLAVRRDMTAAVLRKKARGEKNGRIASRLFALANVLDGMSRDQAARQTGMTRQTLCDWVTRYNAEGLAGLKDRFVGSERRLTTAQEKEIESLVLAGPEGTLVRWRRIDLQKEIEKRFKIAYHERTIGKILHRLGFSHMSVRALNPETSTQEQDAFKKTSPPKSRKSCPSAPKAKPSSSGSRTKPASAKKER